MILNNSKTARQKEFAERWKRSDQFGAQRKGSGTFWAVTGFGKTFGTIQQIIIPYIRRDAKREIIILVCRQEHHSNWNNELDKFLPNIKERKRIKVFTVQSLIKNGATYYTDLLVVDELHKFYGEDWGKYIDGTKIRFKHNLGLTATFIDKVGRHKKYLNHWYPIDRITQKEALEKGWISRFIEYNLGVNMLPAEKELYVEFQKDISKNLAKFGKGGYKTAFACHRGYKEDGVIYKPDVMAEMYAEHMGFHWNLPRDSDIFRQWNPKIIRGYAKKLVEATKARGDLLYHNQSKFDATMSVIEKFRGRKMMTFGQSSEFADKIAEEYNNRGYGYGVVFHTQLKSRPLKDEHGEWIKYKSGKKKDQPKIFGKATLKKIALNAFLTNKANLLATVSALDEGFNDESIEVGITTGRTSNPSRHTQRGGRVKRVMDNDPFATKLIVNIYNQGTKDYDWLRAAQKDSPHTIQWVSEVDDITYQTRDQDVYDISDIL